MFSIKNVNYGYFVCTFSLSRKYLSNLLDITKPNYRFLRMTNGEEMEGKDDPNSEALGTV